MLVLGSVSACCTTAETLPPREQVFSEVGPTSDTLVANVLSQAESTRQKASELEAAGKKDEALAEIEGFLGFVEEFRPVADLDDPLAARGVSIQYFQDWAGRLQTE